jgi:hypothetical protein
MVGIRVQLVVVADRPRIAAAAPDLKADRPYDRPHELTPDRRHARIPAPRLRPKSNPKLSLSQNRKSRNKPANQLQVTIEEVYNKVNLFYFLTDVTQSEYLAHDNRVGAGL